MALDLDILGTLPSELQLAFENGADLGYSHVNHALTQRTGDENERQPVPHRFEGTAREREAWRDGWGMGAMQARADHEALG